MNLSYLRESAANLRLADCHPVTTFQVEKIATFVPDAHLLFPLHYKELALDQDQIKFGFDAGRYLQFEQEGKLHIVTVRSDGRLVGYFIAVIVPHLHYKDAGLMAQTDMYYLLPEFRNGTGVKMLIEVERTLRQKGVTKFFISCKVHQDHSELFEKMGFAKTDVVFAKLLK